MKYSFLQSREWGKFQEAVGRRVEWVKVRDREVQVVYMPLPFGLWYAQISRADLDEDGWREIVERVWESGAVFVRIEPLDQQSKISKQLHKVRDNQPSTTRIIDLSLSEEELLAGMKPKTRYNIRLAERKGVVVQEAKGVWGIRKFLRLLEKTKERQQFTVHAPEYYEKMLAMGVARLFVARYNGKVRTANIVVSCGDTATYLHGASSEKDREVMAPYLLHWMTMLWAKKHGLRWYDLWGVAPPPHPSPLPRVEREIIHPLASVSRFKEGFGGAVVTYPGTFEIPLRPVWYSLVRFHRRTRHLV